MTNTYIIPVCDFNADTCYIKTFRAHSIEEAQDKIINQWVEKYDIDYPDSWEDFKQIDDFMFGDFSLLDEYN